MNTIRDRAASPSPCTELVRLEIAASVLARLIVRGHLRPAELHCLDCASMNCLSRSCLQCCRWRDSEQRLSGCMRSGSDGGDEGRS